MIAGDEVERVPDAAHLREIVRRRQVCWEVYPITLKTAAGLRHVGYELELFGTHDYPEYPIAPGGPECRAVFRDLLEVAAWIIPRERRESLNDVERSPVALRFSPKRKFRREARLTISIVHREGFDRPIDACEIRCLKEMQNKLGQLGARLGS